jgi:hypothetical protein
VPALRLGRFIVRFLGGAVPTVGPSNGVPRFVMMAGRICRPTGSCLDGNCSGKQ